MHFTLIKPSSIFAENWNQILFWEIQKKFMKRRHLDTNHGKLLGYNQPLLAYIEHSLILS